ncbi:34683_t:CDS:2, partial [Gigaspora margarita]
GNTSLHQTPPLINTEHIYIFVDNSDVFIEGKYAIAELENLGTFDNKRHSPCFNQFRIDNGKLLATIQGNRKLGDEPVIVGSRPLPNDSLWMSVREQGYDAMVYDRNIENHTDVVLAHSIDEVIFTKSPGILALVSGDSDYDPIVTTALKCNWIVETWFWNMGMPDELKDKTIFTPLDYHYKSFSCGFGPDFGKNNRILEVIGHAVQDWGNREMISMFVPLNVFCWWNRINDETLHLYFNQKMQLQLVKNWIKNSPHELQFKEKSFLLRKALNTLGLLRLYDIE